MSDISRLEAIGILKYQYNYGQMEQSVHDALGLAIASLETDEAYQLEYEQPEFCANCIDRKALLAELDKRMKNFKGFVGSCNGITSGIYQFVQGMPSVLPKAKKPEECSKDCIFTLEELDLISQCLSKHFYSINGVPNVVISCAEKIERLKKEITDESTN